MAKTITRVRSAINGQFVPAKKAVSNPDTTVTQVIRIKGKK